MLDDWELAHYVANVAAFLHLLILLIWFCACSNKHSHQTRDVRISRLLLFFANGCVVTSTGYFIMVVGDEVLHLIHNKIIYDPEYTTIGTLGEWLMASVSGMSLILFQSFKLHYSFAHTIHELSKCTKCLLILSFVLYVLSRITIVLIFHVFTFLDNNTIILIIYSSGEASITITPLITAILFSIKLFDLVSASNKHNNTGIQSQTVTSRTATSRITLVRSAISTQSTMPVASASPTTSAAAQGSANLSSKDNTSINTNTNGSTNTNTGKSNSNTKLYDNLCPKGTKENKLVASYTMMLNNNNTISNNNSSNSNNNSGNRNIKSNSSIYFSSKHNGALSIKQEKLLQTMTKQTLLTCIESLCFVLYWIINVKLTFESINEIDESSASIFLEIVRVVNSTVWPTCVCLSFVFAKKQYFCCCGKLHDCCFAIYEKLAIYSMDKAEQEAIMSQSMSYQHMIDI